LKLNKNKILKKVNLYLPQEMKQSVTLRTTKLGLHKKYWEIKHVSNST